MFGVAAGLFALGLEALRGARLPAVDVQARAVCPSDCQLLRAWSFGVSLGTRSILNFIIMT